MWHREGHRDGLRAGNRAIVAKPELFTSDLLRGRKALTCFVKQRHVFANVLSNMLRSHVILFLASASTHGPSRRTS